MQVLVRALRSGAWLQPGRVRRWLVLLLTLEVMLAVLFTAVVHGAFKPQPHPATTDFVSFYAAGRLAATGAPWLAYDHAAHALAEEQAREPGIGYIFFYYPPIFLILCRVLAMLPYVPAFLAFQAATLAPCVLALRRILPAGGAILALAFPAVFWTLGLGQNAFLSAALFAFATLLLEERPVLAGLLFGLLCYKPHFGLLIPVALLAGGHWRAIAAATVSVTALVAVSVLLFGLRTWQAFLSVAPASPGVYNTPAGDIPGLTSPYGAVLQLGGGTFAAGIVQGCVTLGAVALVAWVWRRRRSLALRAAMLIAATPVAVPICMFYDLMLSGLALAWLVRHGVREGFPPWTRSAMVLVFLLPLLSSKVAGDARLLMAPAAALGTFALAVAFAFPPRPVKVTVEQTAAVYS